ncbi:hypothetical protein [Streptomyces erythrochromogenes]|uniref:hypothetical protein n=1 Tax=Streptomyces erythrochromogenes TaxID=285574 RepID=UPI003679DDA4
MAAAAPVNVPSAWEVIPVASRVSGPEAVALPHSSQLALRATEVTVGFPLVSESVASKATVPLTHPALPAPAAAAPAAPAGAIANPATSTLPERTDTPAAIFTDLLLTRRCSAMLVLPYVTATTAVRRGPVAVRAPD